ncbi:MAG: hypothetical protein PHQ36_08795 [Anaerolineales bacterium]|nr:hypothetical protein [Anaerolineales bacterium]
MTKPRINPFSTLFDLLIDFALIGMGVLLYYHFSVHALAPVTLSPIVVDLFGSKTLAVWVISGVPVLAGVLSLLRTLFRIIRKPFVSS